MVFSASSSDQEPFGSATVAVFHDRTSLETVVLSVNAQGKPVTLGATPGKPRLSSDGRCIAWSSESADIVVDDRNAKRDVFLSDRLSKRTVRVSRASSGSEANGDSDLPFVSARGERVYFRSAASNLVSNDANGKPDLFVTNLERGTVERLILSNDGSDVDWSGPSLAIAADAEAVAFLSQDAALLELPTSKDPSRPLAPQVFVRDLRSRKTECLSCDPKPSGQRWSSGHPAISPNGRYVAFDSMSSELAHTAPDRSSPSHIYLYDRGARVLERVLGVGVIDALSVSDDGRILSFSQTELPSPEEQQRLSEAGRSPILVQIKVFDRLSQRLLDISRGMNGTPPNHDVFGVALSADGNTVVFDSSATNLIPNQPVDPGHPRSHLFAYDGLRLAGEPDRLPFGQQLP